jgi:LPS export ABC transporter protein LptC
MVQEKKGRIRSNYLRIGILLLFSFGLFSCFKEQNPDQMVNYNGPFMEVDNVETLFTDSSVLRIRLKAPKQMEQLNGDRIFPNGVYVEFFDVTGKKTSTLKANTGNYYKDQSLYVVKGNVIINNLEKEEKLNTEELNWDPETKKIYTDKYLRIESPEKTIEATGMDAKEDFSNYKLRKVIGEIYSDDLE